MTGYPDGAFGALGSITRAEAVVTLDRVRKSGKKRSLKRPERRWKMRRFSGDLVIAESVGEGNVTLKNVTVLGSVIVKGGGANSVYFDGVRVGGTVRLQKGECTSPSDRQHGAGPRGDRSAVPHHAGQHV